MLGGPLFRGNVLTAARPDCLRRIVCALLLMLALAPSAASARDWIERVWMLEDPSATQSFGAVRARTDWRPVEDHLSLGFTSAALWLRVERAADAPAVPMRLRIRPAYLDRIDVYQPVGDGGWSVQTLGDRLPRGGNLLSDSAFSARIDGGFPGPIYVRVHTQSTMAVFLALMEEADAFHAAALEHLAFGIYFGLMSFLALWAFASAWLRRDAALAVFGVYLVALTGMGLGITGLAAAFLLDGVASDCWTSGFVLSSTLSASFFHRIFLGRFQPSRWSLWAVDACIAVSITNFVLLAFAEARLPLSLNAWLVLFGTLAVSVAAFVPGSKTSAEQRTLLVAYGLILVTLGLTMLPVLGTGVGGALTIHLTMGHGLLVAVTLSMTLARLGRIDLLERQRLRLAQEQAARELAMISQQKEESDRFLAMLTHELRNAFGTATLVLQRIQAGDFPDLEGIRPPAASGSVSPALPFSPEMTASLARASASLTAAAAVLDKVQTTRQLEGSFSLDSATALVAVRMDDCIDRLGLTAVTLSLEPGLTLRQDWTYVDLILANLLENADRYREPGTIIHVSTETAKLAQGQGVVLVMRNRRMSRSVVDPDKVFEKYWREAHSHSHRGAGLGLWLSRHAARALGGDLVCRLVGPDIEFTLSLPDR